MDDTHSAAAATRRGFDNDRVADLTSHLDDIVGIFAERAI